MLTLVVPTYNERHNLPTLLQRLEAPLSKCEEPFEVIVVDDDSPDGTSQLARSLQKRYPWLRVLTRTNQRDLSTAVLAGWFEGSGDILAVIDGDLQHPPELLPVLVQRLKQADVDLVIASRHVEGGGVSQWSLFRRMLSWGATLMGGAILPGTLSRVRDPMSGFFVLRRKVIQGAPMRPVGYKILLEVLAKGEYHKVEEIPYIFQERFRGGSKLGPRTGWQYLLHLASIAVGTGELRRVLKYALVGLSGAAVTFGALELFTRVWQWPFRFAVPAATALAIVNNFIWNDRLTFPETGRRTPGVQPRVQRFGRFLWVVLIGFMLNMAVAASLIRFAGAPLEIGVLFGIAAASFWNFLVNSRVTWKVWWDRDVHLRNWRGEGVPPVPGDLKCNFCGGTQFVTLYRGRGVGPASRPDLFCCTSIDHGDYTNIVRCIGCSLVFQAPADPVPEIEQCYRNVEDPVYLREEHGRIRTFDRLLDEIADQRSPGGSLLDVGCYTGVFLDRARKRGWEVTGLEPSQWAARVARSRGLNVSNSLLSEADLAPESFDVITVWDVIEHFGDPMAEVERLQRLLRPGGLLALSTMDVESGFARLLGPRWPWFMRMHLYYFSPETLRAMLGRYGLDVTSVRRHRRIVSVRYFLEKGAAQTKTFGVLLRAIAKLPGLGHIHVPINFGDIINVYAVKTQKKSVSPRNAVGTAAG
jgi:dolichol-phosphate mannosyltransferase